MTLLQQMSVTTISIADTWRACQPQTDNIVRVHSFRAFCPKYSRFLKHSRRWSSEGQSFFPVFCGHCPFLCLCVFSIDIFIIFISFLARQRVCTFTQTGRAVGRPRSRRDDQGQARALGVGMDTWAGKRNVWSASRVASLGDSEGREACNQCEEETGLSFESVELEGSAGRPSGDVTDNGLRRSRGQGW